MLGTAAWLCLAGMGSSQPVSQVAPAAPASTPPCHVQQRTPLYVGFPDGMPLDSFEETALASRDIVREIRHWACGRSTSPSLAVPSLQLAFAHNASMRLDRLQFADTELAHAHVVLSSLAHEKSRHWRVDLSRAPEVGWAVTHTRIASAQDLSESQ